MEKYYLQFETMKAITKAPERSTMEELLLVLANAEELSCIPESYSVLQQELNVFTTSFHPLMYFKPNLNSNGSRQGSSFGGTKKKD